MADGVWQECCHCKTPMWLPRSLNQAALRGRGTIKFWCAYGHMQWYAEGETDADKLRRERDQLAQRIAHRDDEIKRLEAARDAEKRAAAAARGQVTKLRKRAQAGVCPCCNRSFSGLRRHMATKHPEFKTEEAA